jgi:hypothetical protein
MNVELGLEANPDGTATLTRVSDGRGGKPGPRDSNVRIFLEYFLGESLETYFVRLRSADPARTWREIATDMEETITTTAARLDPARAPLVVRISSDLAFRIGRELGLAGDQPAEPPADT